MMNEEETIDFLIKQQKYLFITRDISILKKQLTKQKNLQNEITKNKEYFITQQNEHSSRKWLSIENYSFSIIEGLNIFIQLKNNDPNSAWIHLITAQNHSVWSWREYDLGNDFQKNTIIHFNNIEKILFPPQTFTSMSMTSVHSTCSICDKEYSDCDHIRGEVYMGKSCSETCTKMKDFVHLAVVSEPDDKKCRNLSYGNGKTMTNVMTLLEEHDPDMDSIVNNE